MRDSTHLMQQLSLVTLSLEVSTGPTIDLNDQRDTGGAQVGSGWRRRARGGCWRRGGARYSWRWSRRAALCTC